ncbi:2,3-diaminopropionate biosynthesis protein SbnA [Actinomycetospora lemnae]|uniref:N-(2-amino-2-carboxyethyl)-L-glutamate synthase n=1 Tax=Actinomycetospora lemnae TaxID=3019891 RepID=A0ABT5SWS4_9PSEU|nr:2,3-diaminopropionate biosynthesis protein SbnA [Actinomycetospora sp. DW7H6]MDD7966153.1 2,3-diaminopropionate biosynthesis protein SbnA [Actinomycetospora sp. DW7H6]
MIYDSISQCIGRTPLVRLSRCFPSRRLEVLSKLEMLNPCGSMKDRPARYIVEQGLAEGSLCPGMRLVESTSGNLGVALAAVARLHGLAFTAVVDPNTTTTNLRLLHLYGATVEMVTERDHAGGFLHTRVARAQELAEEPDTVWVNQYANERNPQAYHDTLATELLEEIDGPIDFLVAAVSTTGSLHGITRGLRAVHPSLRTVAVDATGSVIFGGSPGPRRIPGFGASRVPELLQTRDVDHVIHIDEADSLAGCRRLVDTEAILAGGSSGAVIAAIDEVERELVEDIVDRPARVVTVLPDRGERYLDLLDDDLGERTRGLRLEREGSALAGRL